MVMACTLIRLMRFWRGRRSKADQGQDQADLGILLTHEPVRRGLKLSDYTRYVLAVEPEIIGTLPEGST
jgi:hypothetical protein